MRKMVPLHVSESPFEILS